MQYSTCLETRFSLDLLITLLLCGTFKLGGAALKLSIKFPGWHAYAIDNPLPDH